MAAAPDGQGSISSAYSGAPADVNEWLTRSLALPLQQRQTELYLEALQDPAKLIQRRQEALDAAGKQAIGEGKSTYNLLYSIGLSDDAARQAALQYAADALKRKQALVAAQFPSSLDSLLGTSLATQSIAASPGRIQGSIARNTRRRK